MKPIFLSLAILAFICGCESTTDPIGGIGGDGSGGGAITPAQASGNWSFSLRKTTTFACTGGSIPDNQSLSAHIDVSTDGSVTSATSGWATPPGGSFRPLSGSVRLSDGLADLSLLSSAGSTSEMELLGTMTTTGTFRGTLTDPAAGKLPIFSVGGCEYSATGVKTS